MVAVELSVPTGFAPVIETQKALMYGDSTIIRYEVGSRMVVLYIGELPTTNSVGWTSVPRHFIRSRPVQLRPGSAHTTIPNGGPRL